MAMLLDLCALRRVENHDVMEIEFVLGEWTCKSIPLFITTSRLVCPDVPMALLPDFALYGGWRTIMEIEFVIGEWTCMQIYSSFHYYR